MPDTKTWRAQLTSVGEGAVGKLTQYPVTRQMVESAVQVKDKVEKLVLSVIDLEGRVSKLEKRVDALDKPKRAVAKKTEAPAESDSSD
jgi:hypothetical protein